MLWNSVASEKQEDVSISEQNNPVNKNTQTEINQKETTGSNLNKITISIYDDGFSPSNTTINAGDSIVFINNGKNTHWPASNNHPSHEIYPEFDPKRPITPGSSWEFQFNKSGSWKMHDHLSPRLNGIITVN